ncbi:MAG TPA: glycine betaine ABC transporter substrate-binding protein [Acidobacteriota bacterium]|nr:glycine betaine ABC transporter substrate-binding protein [Acidobacteriota bacterium]
MRRHLAAATVALGFLWIISCRVSETVKIGSKAFTESVILGELASQLAGIASPNVVHLKALGGTRILWDALVKGDIDMYPEYTGTLSEEIFAGKNIHGEGEIAGALARYDIKMSISLGFDDSYALGMKETLARQLNITSISDLRRHPELHFGFSNEFMDRRDGWAGLSRFYHLPQGSVAGLEHQLAYRALESGVIAVTDLYTTDADILYYHLKVLNDDEHFFPVYTAVLLYRADLQQRAPQAVKAFLRLQGRISQDAMIRMNGRTKLEGLSPGSVAAEFLDRNFSIRPEVENRRLFARLFLRTKEHVFLVSISLLAAILISVPLGVLAFLYETPGQVVLASVGIIQTIPSLALIVFMIPLLGIGNVPAIVALFAYSLLPIVRSTHSGLKDIPLPIRESAETLGLPRLACLRLVELPIASRSILSGIKTSAVINVGTATLGALIGAGGYGQPILTGIRLNDLELILEGAVPAALLALLVQGLFDLLEIVMVPKGLRVKAEG